MVAWAGAGAWPGSSLRKVKQNRRVLFFLTLHLSPANVLHLSSVEGNDYCFEESEGRDQEKVLARCRSQRRNWLHSL